jgi:hypothetical protein
MNKRLCIKLIGPIVMGAVWMSVTAHAQDANAPERKIAVEGPLASLKHSEAELEKLVPPARPEDVASPEAIVRAMHNAVDGPKGDWNSDRFRSLFLPNAFIAYEDDESKDGAMNISTITLDDLVRDVRKLHQQTSWDETVVDFPTVIRIRRDVEGHVVLATVLAAVIEGPEPQATHPKDKELTATTTCMYIGKRWWIVSHVW